MTSAVFGQTLPYSTAADNTGLAVPLTSDYAKPSVLPLPPSRLPAEHNYVAPTPSKPSNAPPVKPPVVEQNNKSTPPAAAKNSAPAPFDDSQLSSLFETGDNSAPIPDPNEGTNRQILDFNIFLDRAFLKPVSSTVNVILPTPVKQILKNILKNLTEPSKFVFLTLSGHFNDALLTLSRFTINSTLGVGGAFDPASSMGMTAKDANADLMLAQWGVPMGNYSMSFFTGPSQQRSSLSGYADMVINPANLLYNLIFPDESVIISAGQVGANALLNRPAALDSLADFADPYAVAKSVYWQNYKEKERKYMKGN